MNDMDTITAALRDHDSFLIVAHRHPDGDAVGASLALAMILEKMGKRAVVYNQDPPPHYCRFMAGFDRIVDRADPNEFPVVIAVDCGELHRAGTIAESLRSFPLLLNIDHHASNPNFGHGNLVDEEASSSGELVHRILRALDIPLDPDLATAIYAAIYFDTRSFHNANSTSEAFRICGAMVDAGADPGQIARYLFVEQKPERAVLLGLVLPSLKIEAEGRIAGMAAGADTIRQAGADHEALEGFVEIPMSIEGVTAAYLLRELKGKNGEIFIKGSLRTTEKIDATVVAGYFNGGGHRRASGFTTPGTLEKVRLQLVERLRRHLD